MKIIHNSPLLKSWLSRNKSLVNCVDNAIFQFDDAVFDKMFAEIHGHHPNMLKEQIELRSAYHLLYLGHKAEVPKEKRFRWMRHIPRNLWSFMLYSQSSGLYFYARIIWALLILALLGFLAVNKAHAQGSGVGGRTTSGITLRVQNQGTTIATRGGGLFIINCSTNLTCSWSGSTLTMTGAVGGGMGCTLQGGTNLLLYDTSTACNDITKFSTNGTTTITGAATSVFDMSLGDWLSPGSAGYAPTVGKHFGYDSTANQYVFGQNGATVSFGLVGGTTCVNQVLLAFHTLATSSPTSTCHTIVSGDTSGTFPATAHNLLSATHGDTVAASPVRGDMIIANSTPAWTKLAIGGSGTYPKSNGTDIVNSTMAASGVGTPTVCTNQVVTGFTLAGDTAPVSTCTSLTSSFIPALACSTITNGVCNNAVNTGTTAMTLDLNAITTVSGFRTQVLAGAAPALNGAIAYDSTNNNFHGGLSSADSKFASFTVTPAANNNCVKWVVSGSNYLLGDQGAACGAGGANHNLLSATHPDTVAASPVRGDMIIANSTPAWTKLAIGGSGTYPKSNGTDVVTSTLGASGVGSCASHKFETADNSDAAPTCTQPTLADIAAGVAPAGAFDFTGATPTVPTQSATDNSTKAASTAYVTTGIANAIAAVNPAVAVQAATTSAADTSGFTYANGVGGIGATFTGSVNTAVVIDGFTFTALGQRLLVKNDTQAPSGAFNGVYYVTQLQTGVLAPILTRALDYNQPSDINNTGAIPVVNGTANADTSWLLTSSVTTVGTDPLTYIQFSANPTTLVTGNCASVGYNAYYAASGTVLSCEQFVPVTQGGTNKGSITAGTLLCGNGTGTPTEIAVGVAGQLITSNGGSACPTAQDPIVSGPDAVGAAPTKNPVQTGGIFLTTPATLTNNQVGATQMDNKQNILVNIAGQQLSKLLVTADAITIGAALPAGTNQIGHVVCDSGCSASSNSPAAPSFTAEVSRTVFPTWGAAKPGVSPINSELMAGQFGQLIAPLTRGQSVPFQVDSYGRLLVNLQSSVVQPVMLQDASGMRAVYDPCETFSKQYGSQSITANTQILTGTAGRKIYFCSWNDNVAGTTENYAVVEGTGSTCATSIAAFPGLSGGTTAATGWNVAANSGRTYGNGGASIAGQAVNGDNVCVLLSASVQLNIGYSYVIAP